MLCIELDTLYQQLPGKAEPLRATDHSKGLGGLLIPVLSEESKGATTLEHGIGADYIADPTEAVVLVGLDIHTDAQEGVRVHSHELHEVGLAEFGFVHDLPVDPAFLEVVVQPLQHIVGKELLVEGVRVHPVAFILSDLRFQ